MPDPRPRESGRRTPGFWTIWAVLVFAVYLTIIVLGAHRA